MRLIDSDALRQELIRCVFRSGDGTAELMQADTVLHTIADAPTVCCGIPSCAAYPTKRADALIAALGDEIAELTGQNIDLEVWRASAVKRAEQAEADLAAWRAFCDEWVDIAFEVQQQDHKRYTQAEAEVALRDRMLRDIIERIALTPERWNGWTTEEVLADLRARAEK